MIKFPKFASPVPKERREYLRELIKLHRGEVFRDFNRPIDPLEPFQDMAPIERKKLISLRVDGYLLELTKEAARQHDMSYQVVIRIWIQEGLRRAILEAPEDSEPFSFYSTTTGKGPPPDSGDSAQDK